MAASFDVAFRKSGTPEHPALVLTIPAAIGRSLIEKELNRAILTVTEAGILVRPYPAGESRKKNDGRVEIPSSWMVEP